MSMMIFEKSTVFNPSDYGLNVGDIIQVVCVGGGAGGSSGAGAGGAAGEGGKSCTYTYEDTTSSKVYNMISYSYTENPGGGGSGRGYGAGGGGGGGGIHEAWCVTSEGWSSGQKAAFKYAPGGAGGGAGKVEIVTVLITKLDPIVITIGQGGEADMPGEATSFGEYLTARGGNVGEGAVASGDEATDLITVYNSKQVWSDGTPDSLIFSGGGGGEGGYIIGLPLGGKFDHDRNQKHAVAAKGGTGGNGLGVICNINKEVEANYRSNHGMTIAAPETITESTVVERGGCGGAYTDGESVGIGHGVCIVTW